MSFGCFLGELSHTVGTGYSVIELLGGHSHLLLKLINPSVGHNQVVSSRILSLFHRPRHLYSLLKFVMSRPPIVRRSRFLFRLADHRSSFSFLHCRFGCSHANLNHLHLNFWLAATRGLMTEKLPLRHGGVAVAALPADVMHLADSRRLRLVIHTELRLWVVLAFLLRVVDDPTLRISDLEVDFRLCQEMPILLESRLACVEVCLLFQF